MPDASASKSTFEESLLRLEALVEKLENAELTLDEALNAFEEGTALARTCRERLDAAELRVDELTLDD